MAYYLGRDVTVTLKTESADRGVTAAGAMDSDGTGGFATDSAASGDAVTDLTSVDIGIGVQDEDITYMGNKSVLKAEIKKETTCSLTRKKSDATWEKVFNAARWGVVGTTGLHDGLTAPPTASSGQADYGYQVIINMSAASDVLTLRNATITGHTVSLNADGSADETLEFVTQVAPVVS